MSFEPNVPNFDGFGIIDNSIFPVPEAFIIRDIANQNTFYNSCYVNEYKYNGNLCHNTCYNYNDTLCHEEDERDDYDDYDEYEEEEYDE